jgi:hypothetical protein
MWSFLVSSPNMIKMIKARKMRWTRHVAHMEEKRITPGFGGKPE